MCPDSLLQLPRALNATVFHAWAPCIAAARTFTVNVTHSNADAVAHALLEFKTVERLTLLCDGLERWTGRNFKLPGQIELVALAACSLPRLVSLRVSLGQAHMLAALVRYLPVAAGLTRLALTAPAVVASDERMDLMRLRAAALQLPQLRSLELQGPGFARFARDVAEGGAGHLRHLRALTLSHRVAVGDLAALVDALGGTTGHTPWLESLTLDHCVQCTAVAPAASALPHAMHAAVHACASVSARAVPAHAVGGGAMVRMRGGAAIGAHAYVRDDAQTERLAAAVSRLSSLREFSFREGDGGSAGKPGVRAAPLPPGFVWRLCRGLVARCRGLTRLELTDQSPWHLPEAAQLFRDAMHDAAEVAALLAACQELQELRLEGIRMHADGTLLSPCRPMRCSWNDRMSVNYDV